MTTPPTKPKPDAGKLTPARALEAAAKPVEVVGHAMQHALDPLTSAIKRATAKRPEKAAEPEPAAAPGKPGLAISPLAVPFPKMPPVGGVQIGIGRAGFYKHERPDLLVMRFAKGTPAVPSTSRPCCARATSPPRVQRHRATPVRPIPRKR